MRRLEGRQGSDSRSEGCTGPGRPDGPPYEHNTAVLLQYRQDALLQCNYLKYLVVETSGFVTIILRGLVKGLFALKAFPVNHTTWRTILGFATSFLLRTSKKTETRIGIESAGTYCVRCGKKDHQSSECPWPWL